MSKSAKSCAARRWQQSCAAALLAAALQAAAPAAEVVLRVHQGTDISVAPGGDGQLVTDVGGRLWALPAEGGTAVPLTAPNSFARRPRLSPDGRTLAFEAPSAGFSQIMLMDLDGGNLRAATAGPAQHWSPAWSHDGKRLGFASDRGGDVAVWELDLEGGGLRQLTFEPGAEIDPAWSPADGALAYVSHQGTRHALVVRSAGGLRRVLVDSPYVLRAPAWRPDGAVLTFVSGLPQGPRLRMAILSDPVVVKPAGDAETAFAAPVTWLDHNRILYTADGAIRIREIGARGNTELSFEAALSVSPVEDPPARPLRDVTGKVQARGLAGLTPLPNGHLVVSALGDLWEIDAQGQQVRQLTRDAFLDRDPAASRDGQQLAFTSDRGGSPQVWLMDLRTRDMRLLTAAGRPAGHPAWNGPGDRIAFLVAEAGQRSSLAVARVEDGQVLVLASGLAKPGTPAWSPDGAHLAVVHNADNSPQLLLHPLAGGTPRRLTLPAAAVGPGVNELQWSPAGSSLLIASAAGLRTLPMLDNGLVGADWRALSDEPAQLGRWASTGDAVWATGASGLTRVGNAPGAAREAVPFAIEWQATTAGARTRVRASRVFDGRSGDYLYDHDIVIEGGRIVALQPWAADADPATLVDARGKTVVPGLIDLDVQLADSAGERLGRALLAYGITTVQVPADYDAELRELAERWQAWSAGPRLLRSAHWCGGTLAPPPADVAGLDDGALRLCPAALGDLAQLPENLHAARLPLWADSWQGALSGRVHAVSPGLAPSGVPGDGAYYQDAIDVMTRSGVVLVSALAAHGMAQLVEEQPDLLAGPRYLQLFTATERDALARGWREARSRGGAGARVGLRMRQRALGRLVAAGGHLAAASHAPAVPYGLGLHAELRLLAGAGLAPAQVLAMATAQAARSLGLQDELGRLAPGLRADLLVVDGDPLRDLGHLLRIESVMTDGALRPMADLVPVETPPLENFTSAPRRSSPKPRQRPR